MQGFELTRAKRDLYVGVLRSRAFPVQIIWGRRTRPQGHTFGEIARRAAGVDHIHRLPGKHFLQEDQSPALAELITAQAAAVMSRRNQASAWPRLSPRNQGFPCPGAPAIEAFLRRNVARS